MSELIIRPYQPEDQETLVEIALAAWEPIYAHTAETMGPEMYRQLYPDWRDAKASKIRWACGADSGNSVCVAEQAGRIVGFATYSLDPAKSLGEIHNNAVWPDCRGQGIAGRLYAFVMDNLRAQGASYVTVQTGGDPAHAPARRAYEKAGFDVALPNVRYYRKL